MEADWVVRTERFVVLNTSVTGQWTMLLVMPIVYCMWKGPKPLNRYHLGWDGEQLAQGQHLAVLEKRYPGATLELVTALERLGALE